MAYRNILMLSILTVLLSACCGEIRYSKEVDVSPLYELPLPLNIHSEDDLAELDIFDQIVPHGYGYLGEWLGGETSKHPDFYGVQVYWEVSTDILSANNAFTSECEGWSFNDPSRFDYSGEEGNRYCISYVQEYRDPPDAFCAPTGKYVSFVVFQKGNLVIRIWEETRDKDSTVKDDVIELLAQELGK